MSDLCLYASILTLTFLFFFFNDTATTEIYTLSLHDALPISHLARSQGASSGASYLRAPPPPRAYSARRGSAVECPRRCGLDRKSTRLNSSHGYISYAVFCLKKKKKKNYNKQ